MNPRYLPSILFGVLSAVACLVLVWFVDSQISHRQLGEYRARVIEQLSTVGARIENSLYSRLSLAEGLAAFVKSSEERAEGRSEAFSVKFHKFSSELLKDVGGIRSLQLAPGGVVTYINPLKGNEAALGHDLRADPARREAVDRAIRERKFIVAGPVTLRQGGVALIGRLPIFLPTDGEQEKELFWGLSIVLIDLEQVLKDSGLSEQKTEVQFAIRGKDGRGAEGAVFYGDGSLFQADSVMMILPLPNGSWQIAAMPLEGWGGLATGQGVLRFIGGALAIVVGLLVFFILNKNAHLNVALAHKEKAESDLVAAQRIARLGNWSRDVESDRLEWSDEVYRIFGREPGEFTPTYDQLLKNIHPDDRKSVQNSLEKAILERTSHSMEYRIIRQDGEILWVHVNSIPIYDEAGKPVGISGTLQDITDRKLVEKALEKSEGRFRHAFENAPVGISLISPEGRRLQVNQAMADFLGYTVEELIDTEINNTSMNDDTFDKTLRLRQQALDGEFETYTNERKHRHKKGHALWGEVSSSLFRNEDGEPEHFITHVVDITTRKQAEEGLRASEARLTEIFAIAPEAVITVGSDMNIQLFNQGAERIFGYSADEVLGRPLEILMPEQLREDHRKHVQGFDGSGDTYRLMDQRQEILGLRKDGTEFPASASVSKLEIGSEKIFTVMLKDITEGKRAEEALMVAMNEAQTANRAKSEFLAAMSHDLRTPLNAILGFADIISHQFFGPVDDKYREYADDIHSSGEHLLTLVNDILDLSTIEAGKQSLVKEKLSTLEIVRECERIVEDKARSHGIDLITEIPKGLPPLYADKRATKQILLNLLANAVKFTPEGGKITVSAEASKKNTTLKIADTGKGIPAEKISELTDPFVKVNHDPYLTEQGWGLGLTITKSLVGLHNGTLDIQSKVGKGTTVTVTFPNGAP